VLSLAAAILGGAALAQLLPGAPEARAADAPRPVGALNNRPPSNVQPTTTLAAAVPPQASFAEVERQYLESRISAREFRKYLEQYVEAVNRAAVAPPGTASDVRAPAATSNPPADASKAAVPSAPPASAPPPPPPPAPPSSTTQATPSRGTADPAIDALERRMEELLRQRAQRAAAQQARPPSGAPSPASAGAGSAGSLREQLDALLRLHLEGAISRTEYEARRARLLAPAK
jgi:hypothetical protein